MHFERCGGDDSSGGGADGVGGVGSDASDGSVGVGVGSDASEDRVGVGWDSGDDGVGRDGNSDGVGAARRPRRPIRSVKPPTHPGASSASRHPYAAAGPPDRSQ